MVIYIYNYVEDAISVAVVERKKCTQQKNVVGKKKKEEFKPNQHFFLMYTNYNQLIYNLIYSYSVLYIFNMNF